ncbi:MAG: hypothetical protein WC444_05490 [Candidatus Paceibacterota bacterium]
MGKVLSNYEFAVVASKQSPWMAAKAKKRLVSAVKGFVSRSDLNVILAECVACNKPEDAKWIRAVMSAYDSGKLSNLRQDKGDWVTHLAHVRVLSDSKKIPFGLREMVMVKDTGMVGQVMDYLVDKDEYVVVLNPFEIKQLPASALLKSNK